MNSAERRNAILEIIKDQKQVKIIELSSMLNVSRETIRNDLYEIEQTEGLIKKVYGGAVLDETTKESAYDKRKETNKDAKKQIAKIAADLIEDGDTIYLDYGTTVLNLAEMLTDKKDLTVVTNTLPIINILAECENINLFVPGGVIRRNELSFAGASATRAINDIYVDIGFFGCSGINSKSEITNIFEGEVDFSRKILQQSTNAIILADHTKFGITSYKQVAKFTEVDVIITDKVIDTELRNVMASENKSLKIIESSTRGTE